MKKKSLLFFLPFIIVLINFGGCVNRQNMPLPEVQSSPNAYKITEEYYIQPGDQLDIKFYYHPELNESVTVRSDGAISLQLVDDVQASGLTPLQLDEVLAKKFSNELLYPVITVIVRSSIGTRIYVGGEVNNQGLINLTTNMTALNAIIRAGGFKDTARADYTLIIRKGPDNKPIPIRVNLKKALKGNDRQQDFSLKPHDIIYVPKTSIAKVNTVVDQYLRQLVLFNGVNFGFSYDMNNNK